MLRSREFFKPARIAGLFLFLTLATFLGWSQNIITSLVSQASGPGGPAVDSAGNIYYGNAGYLLKLAPNGASTTIGGNGTQGISGDGGPALNASLGFIQQLAVDSSGRVCFGDIMANKIRFIKPPRG